MVLWEHEHQYSRCPPPLQTPGGSHIAMPTFMPAYVGMRENRFGACLPYLVQSLAQLSNR